MYAPVTAALLTLHGVAAAAPALPAQESACIAEAIRAADHLGAGFWPGWSAAPFAVLLVTDSVEFLLAHPAPSPEFVPTGERFQGAPVRCRPRVFPTRLQATMPAVGGVPTIVIGTLAHTGLSAARWTVTLLHEHFHQVQMSAPGYFAGVDALGLSGGDPSGRWMIDYPFPYADAQVDSALTAYQAALHAAVAGSDGGTPAALATCTKARERLYGLLAPADARYLALQLWQEGFARYIEHRALVRLAAGGWSWAEATGITEPVARLAQAQADQCRAELLALRAATDQRTCFYAIGWAEGLLLERAGLEVGARYAAEPYRTATLFSEP